MSTRALAVARSSHQVVAEPDTVVCNAGRHVFTCCIQQAPFRPLTASIGVNGELLSKWPAFSKRA